MTDRFLLLMLTALVVMCGIDTFLAVRYLSGAPMQELHPVNRWLMTRDPTMSEFVAAKWTSTLLSCGFCVLLGSYSKKWGRLAVSIANAIMLAVLLYAAFA